MQPLFIFVSMLVVLACFDDRVKLMVNGSAAVKQAGVLDSNNGGTDVKQIGSSDLTVLNTIAAEIIPKYWKGHEIKPDNNTENDLNVYANNSLGCDSEETEDVEGFLRFVWTELKEPETESEANAYRRALSKLFGLKHGALPLEGKGKVVTLPRISPLAKTGDISGKGGGPFDPSSLPNKVFTYTECSDAGSGAYATVSSGVDKLNSKLEYAIKKAKNDFKPSSDDDEEQIRIRQNLIDINKVPGVVIETEILRYIQSEMEAKKVALFKEKDSGGGVAPLNVLSINYEDFFSRVYYCGKEPIIDNTGNFSSLHTYDDPEEQVDPKQIVGGEQITPKVTFGSGRYMMVSDLYGMDLEEIHRDFTNFGAYSVLHICKQLITILFVLSELDIIHRDIKPGNILVTRQDSSKIRLIDFEFARSIKLDGITINKSGKAVNAGKGTATFLSEFAHDPNNSYTSWDDLISGIYVSLYLGCGLLWENLVEDFGTRPGLKEQKGKEWNEALLKMAARKKKIEAQNPKAQYNIVTHYLWEFGTDFDNSHPPEKIVESELKTLFIQILREARKVKEEGTNSKPDFLKYQKALDDILENNPPPNNTFEHYSWTRKLEANKNVNRVTVRCKPGPPGHYSFLTAFAA